MRTQPFRNCRNSGVTLLEVMMVTVVVGIVATVGVPSYLKTVEESHRTEARHVLAVIRNAELRYHADQGTFTTDWNSLDIEDPTFTSHYFNYTIASAGTDDFSATASRLRQPRTGSTFLIQLGSPSQYVYTLSVNRSGTIANVPAGTRLETPGS